MKAKYKQRLLKLAELHENFKTERKNLVYPAKARLNMDSFYEASKEVDCKTSCCSLGLAALHPYFNELGLTADYTRAGNSLGKTPIDVIYRENEEDSYVFADAAARKVFGTAIFHNSTVDDSYSYLFGPDWTDRTHTIQAAVLRNYVETDGKVLDDAEYKALVASVKKK